MLLCHTAVQNEKRWAVLKQSSPTKAMLGRLVHTLFGRYVCTFTQQEDAKEPQVIDFSIPDWIPPYAQEDTAV